MLAKSTQTPFEPKVILVWSLVLHEVLILLVYRVVGQVHELVVLVNLRGVSLTGKAS